MANIQQVIDAMQAARLTIAQKMGADLTPGRLDPFTAYLTATNDALLAVVIGVLVDRNVPMGNNNPLTLAVFQNALSVALAQDFTPPVVPARPPPGTPS